MKLLVNQNFVEFTVRDLCMRIISRFEFVIFAVYKANMT
jgi:hypothetical protein